MDCRSDSYILTALLITTFLLLQVSPLFPQQESYRMEQILLTGELLNFKGTCILQDNEGFMWFGSRNGLYRYDGTEFKVFRHDPFDPGSIPEDYIFGLVEDSANLLWVVTFWGIVSFDKYSEQFDRSLYNNYALASMHNDKLGNIWLGEFCGGLSKCNIESATMSQIVSCDFFNKTQDQAFEGILIDRSGSMWIRTADNKLYKFDIEARSMENIDTVPCGISNMYEDLSGRFWITSKCGLYQFNKDTKTFERQLFKPGDPNRMKNQIVCDIIEDQSSNIWIRTFDGIYKYSHDLKLKFHWVNPETYEMVHYNFYTNGLFEDKTGTIWFYDKSGIKKLIREYNNFTHFNPDPSASSLSSCIYMVNDDSLFYGNWSKNYYAYNRKENVFEKYVLPAIQFMFKDSREVLWIGTESGLYRSIKSDAKSPEYIRYQSVPGDSSSLPGMHINYIFEDSSGKLWIACRGAQPCYYDRDYDCFIQLVENPRSTDHLTFDSQVRYETDSRELWAINTGVYKIIPPVHKDIRSCRDG